MRFFLQHLFRYGNQFACTLKLESKREKNEIKSILLICIRLQTLQMIKKKHTFGQINLFSLAFLYAKKRLESYQWTELKILLLPLHWSKQRLQTILDAQSNDSFDIFEWKKKVFNRQKRARTYQQRKRNFKEKHNMVTFDVRFRSVRVFGALIKNAKKKLKLDRLTHYGRKINSKISKIPSNWYEHSEYYVFIEMRA